MSEIMDRSTLDFGLERRLEHEDDVLDHYNDIKEMFRFNAQTFDALLNKMGRPEHSKENIVTLKDFENLIRGMLGSKKFT